jgi:hypothetical protein
MRTSEPVPTGESFTLTALAREQTTRLAIWLLFLDSTTRGAREQTSGNFFGTMTSVKARIASTALGTPLFAGIWAHTTRDFIFEIRSRPICSSFTLASGSRSGKEEGDTQPGAMGAIGNGTTRSRMNKAPGRGVVIYT